MQSNHNNEEFRYFIFNLTNVHPTTRAIIIGCGVFISFLSYGVMQEYLFSEKKFPNKLFAVSIQMTIYFILSTFQRYMLEYKRGRAQNLFSRNGSTKWYLALGVILLVGRLMGTLSMGYIDYTIKVMVNSSRPIPLMITAYFIFGDKYTLKQYLGSLLLAIGLSGFSLAHKSSSTSSFSSLGIFLAFIMVTAFSLKSIFQEKLLKGDKATSLEVSQYSNIIGTVLMFFLALISNDLISGIQFCWNEPIMIVNLVFIYLLGYCGSYSSLNFIKATSALTGSISTALRNLIQIVISFIIFGKMISIIHVISVVIFFIGIGLHIYEKQKKKKRKKGL